MTAAIYKKIFQCQQQTTFLVKEMVDPESGQPFTTTEQIIQKTRATLHANGLFIQRSSVSINGPVMTMVFRIVDAESGDYLSYEYAYPCVATKYMPLASACASALTKTMGAFLRDMFWVPRIDVQVAADGYEDMDMASADDGYGVGDNDGDGGDVDSITSIKNYTDNIISAIVAAETVEDLLKKMDQVKKLFDTGVLPESNKERIRSICHERLERLKKAAAS
jgi:hypothetical protein